MYPQCPSCRGRDPGLCGNKICPILSRTSYLHSFNKKIKKDFMGTAPNVFIGRHGYPNVNIGMLSTDAYADNDNPRAWIQRKYSISSIVQLRTQLVNSRFRASVQDRSRFGQIISEMGLAHNPIDVEVSLDKVPHLHTSFGQEILPHGPSVSLVHARVVDNIRVGSIVERVVGDIDVKAVDAVSELGSHYDEHYITKLFSSANLGVADKRKFVPTRWSITAVDDTLGLSLKKKVLEFSSCNNMVFFDSYFGNYFVIILSPGEFSFELNETFLPKSLWNAAETVSYTSDYEGVANRTAYAKNCTGGYYAARLALLRYFIAKKICGSCMIIRVITPEYTTPLGVWVVRQAVTKTLQSKAVVTDSFVGSLRVAERLIENMFRFSLSSLRRYSFMLQKHIGAYAIKEGEKDAYQLALGRFFR